MVETIQIEHAEDLRAEQPDRQSFIARHVEDDVMQQFQHIVVLQFLPEHTEKDIPVDIVEEFRYIHLQTVPSMLPIDRKSVV